MPVSSETIEPTEWFERNTHRGSWFGYTEDFRKYPNITFLFDPFEGSTHTMALNGGWRMEFRQKTRVSRLYLHFHNKKNFGFRIRLPKRDYSSINDMFRALQTLQKYDIYLSEKAVTNVMTKTVYVREESADVSFETAMKTERNRALAAIGDYRGSVRELPDNVIDFTEYLTTPEPIVSTETLAVELMKKLG